MAYFLPSFFQKRLLRYALSRLELVDTEALDLDSLGIRWGQRSTVELRDVGLRLEKLATLLRLPPSSELLGARVRFLQITIPADIHSSGIICEASGIDIHLRLPSDEAYRFAKDGKPSAEGAPHQSAHEPHDQILPTPTNLAQSFLQTEPKEEKEELQAAISSQSQVLHRASTSSSDDEEELGLGEEGLSLPSFVAAFLKGVADRLRVRISDVSVRVDMEMRQDGSSKRQPEHRLDLVTGLLKVREASVGAVFMPSGPDELPSGKEGKRLVSLSDINMALVSDPVVFSNYSRFAPPASPSTTMHSKESRFPSRVPSPPPETPSSPSPDLAQSGIFNRPETASPTPEPPAPEMEGSAYTYEGRFSDADTEAENRDHAGLGGSQRLSDDDGWLDNPAYLDSVIDSQIDDDIEGSGELRPAEEQAAQQSGYNGDTRRSHIQELHTESTEGQRDTRGTENLGDSGRRQGVEDGSETGWGVDEPASNTQGELPEEFRASHEDTTYSTAAPSHHSGPSESRGGGSQSGSDAELSESKVFSSEDVQSMYMSVASHASTSKSFMPNVPGAWDEESARIASHDNADGHSHQDARSDEHDETKVSTPKLTAESDQYVSTDQGGRSEVKSREGPDSESDQPSPVLDQGTGVAKTFLTVEKVSIWLPSAGDEEMVEEPAASHYRAAKEAPGLRESTAEDDLLESKNDASTRFRRDSVDSFSSTGHPQPSHEHPQRRSRHEFGGDSHKIAVEVSSTEAQFDIATGWLLTKMSQKVACALSASEVQSRQSPHSAEKPRSHPLSIAVSNVSVKFVEHISGYAYPSESLHSSPSFRMSVEDVILQATAAGLEAYYSRDRVTKFGLDVSKFVLGFASEDLLSFNENLKMRESTRDIMSPASGDISLSLTKSDDSARINLATLPVQVKLNIQRLDDVLGWFGGMSTILELGSSFSSLSSPKGTKKGSSTRPRGVHFEGTLPSNIGQRGSMFWKVNARVGGISMDVSGENHSLRLTTTAVKAVSRFEGIGVQIDKAKLSGPFPLGDDEDPPAKVSLSNIRVEYLFSPKEVDLDRLLALITPSKDKYDEDDDIMLDTLFRQRRQGSVLRVTAAGMKAVVSRCDGFESLSQLGNELGRLSSVAKYLPEDDRPGILTLVLVKEFEGQIHVGRQVGNISASLRNAEVAYITIPSLIAGQIETFNVVRNGNEELLGEALPLSMDDVPGQTAPPLLMARFIPDEMDPTIKIKLHNLRAEYTIQSVAAFLGLGDDTTSGRMARNMAKSLANLAEESSHGGHASERFYAKGEPKDPSKPSRLAVVMSDSVLGLNPRGTPAKGLVVLTSAKLNGMTHGSESSEVNLDLRKALIMVIDDVQNVGASEPPRRGRSAQSNQAQSLMDMGYVPVSSISSATATAKLMHLSEDGTKSVDVELRDNLLILESCADSTQTLIAIANGLQPPTPPSTTVKYRTEVMPIQDMLASFSGDAYATDQPADNTPGPSVQPENEAIDDELEYVSDFYPAKPGSDDEPIDFAGSGSGDLLDSFHSQYHVSSSVSELDFRDDHFAKQSDVGGTAHRWDSAHNTYGLSNDEKLRRSPLRIRVRDVHVIWNLFDGYDWQQTRDTISEAVKDVEMRTADRRARTSSRASPDADDEEESVIGDCLFNSVYIGIPANKDPRELRADINRNIDDLASETGSYATTSTVTATRQSQSPSMRGKKLRLSRSKHHKMTFELKGISADLVVFPPDSEETQSSLDVRVNDLEIFDHVPSSTWKKFASYMRETGEKESGTSMVHLEMLTVKPVPELAASEIVLKATVLPLRLHVDQDALDFMCRFFEFRDESARESPPGDVPFLQRVEVNAVPVKLDFKPKRVDYAGLRSGRTTEFMNFFVLDAADMLLRHVIIYGVSGFDKLGHTLNDIWMPDIKRNQLPNVLAGLAPIRSLVNVGGGVKDLVVVPMREYRKDGRVVRSMQKGALAFAKTTSNELVKLGAKLAVGTQTVLQGAEELLNTPHAQLVSAEEDAMDEEEAKRISLYADQPIGVVQGLRGAFSGLERDLVVARDAVVAVPGEVVDSGSAKAAAKAVWKRTPTVVLRPAIGVSKAVGQTLLGAGNTLDPGNRRKMEDKYKHH